EQQSTIGRADVFAVTADVAHPLAIDGVEHRVVVTVFVDAGVRYAIAAAVEIVRRHLAHLNQCAGGPSSSLCRIGASRPRARSTTDKTSEFSSVIGAD